MRARRSSLSVPGSSERMLAKAAALEADEIVVDLEDSVAPDAKEQARELVGDLLAAERPVAVAVAVRINPLDRRWGERDVAELVERAGPRIGSLVIPKVESAEDVAGGRPSARCGRRTREPSRSAGPRGDRRRAPARRRHRRLLAAPGGAHPRICGSRCLAGARARPRTARALAVRAGDPACGRPAPRASKRSTGRTSRSVTTTVCGGAPSMRARSASMASGRCTPASSTIINAAFTPGADELARSRAILDALAGAEGRGAVELDGEMIDEASRKLALHVVARGRAAGSTGGRGEPAGAAAACGWEARGSRTSSAARSSTMRRDSR